MAPRDTASFHKVTAADCRIWPPVGHLFFVLFKYRSYKGISWQGSLKRANWLLRSEHRIDTGRASNLDSQRDAGCLWRHSCVPILPDDWKSSNVVSKVEGVLKSDLGFFGRQKSYLPQTSRKPFRVTVEHILMFVKIMELLSSWKIFKR